MPFLHYSMRLICSYSIILLIINGLFVNYLSRNFWLQVSIMISRAFSLAYLLLFPLITYQGAFSVEVLLIISLIASSYRFHFSRLRQSSSVIFQTLFSSSCLASNLSSCSSFEIWMKNLMTIPPKFVRDVSKLLISS